MTPDTLTDDDKARLRAIVAADDPRTIMDLLATYYSDVDRAARTSRSLLYFHMGILCSITARLITKAEGR